MNSELSSRAANEPTSEPFASERLQPTPPTKRENIWLNLALNVIIPSLLMTKGKTWLGIESPAKLLVIALSFPVVYGIYDFVARKKYNFFSVIGFASVLITGGVGLLELDKGWIAIKEAAIPALFGIAVFFSLWTPFPLVRTFLFNPELFNTPKIEHALEQNDNKTEFERLMVQCTLYLVASFALSSVLNFALAKYFIRSETGTEDFVKENGRMLAWSWPVIVVPSMLVTFAALLKLTKGIKDLTGYELEDVMLVGQPAEKKTKIEDEAASQPQEDNR